MVKRYHNTSVFPRKRIQTCFCLHGSAYTVSLVWPRRGDWCWRMCSSPDLRQPNQRGPTTPPGWNVSADHIKEQVVYEERKFKALKILPPALWVFWGGFFTVKNVDFSCAFSNYFVYLHSEAKIDFLHSETGSGGRASSAPPFYSTPPPPLTPFGSIGFYI